ncbi:MAG: hypothetical protein U0522_02445 [Candidatus Paceibacterota bacterium]
MEVQTMRNIVGILALLCAIMCLTSTPHSSAETGDSKTICTSVQHNPPSTSNTALFNDATAICDAESWYENVFAFLKAALLMPVPYDIRSTRLKKKVDGVCTKLGSISRNKILQIG